MTKRREIKKMRRDLKRVLRKVLDSRIEISLPNRWGEKKKYIMTVREALFCGPFWGSRRADNDLCFLVFDESRRLAIYLKDYRFPEIHFWRDYLGNGRNYLYMILPDRKVVRFPIRDF